ncbi:putative integral membrane zinc-ribbon metal-binding protein [Teratosphaeria destructans]|uniref:Endoplasmic reticulum junction formation protein lunapark n=1 Tax=Teratosphaeria destructans TaxID=418781 RepID=A0A9W7W1B0_9PEZI|nr:putative integral membrane zinc-ribbon metal-binding protein [Teratosphaeria destructans]
MVSFWPFKGDETSAASFEKVLSKLSTQITKASAQNDKFRQKQRRYKVLWTLYSSFAYILVAAILTLVTGYQGWGPIEYTTVAGGPVLVYGIRTALDAYYNYRLSNSQSYLNDLYKQREKAIAKLKAATKYDSTQQLLDKYGGSPKKRQPSPQPPAKDKRKSEGGLGSLSASQGPRTGFAPPPTANIQRPQPPCAPLQSASARAPSASIDSPSHMPNGQDGPREEFAPNAFTVPSPPPMMRQQSTQYSDGPKWYDRLLDVILGEDETQAKNRIALICQDCRLVNGQAPPGATTLEDVGKWRCSGCRAMNGVENEEMKMLKRMSAELMSPTSPADSPTYAVNEDVDQSTEDNVVGHEAVEGEPDDTDEVDNSTPGGSTRSKPRQRSRASKS